MQGMSLDVRSCVAVQMVAGEESLGERPVLDHQSDVVIFEELEK